METMNNTDEAIRRFVSLGNGDGYGYGYGYGSKLKTLNGQKVYYIDKVPTLIFRTKTDGDVTYARGALVSNDLTVKDCYIAKEHDTFAHGATAHEAYKALQGKLKKAEPLEQRLAEFKRQFPSWDGEAYQNQDFFDWHHILTGSCLMGRREFAAGRGLSLDGQMTVSDFCALTRNAYGGDVIGKIPALYKHGSNDV